MLTILMTALLAQAAAAQSSGRAAPDARAPAEIIAAAPASDWTAIDADDLLVLDLARDAAGRPRRVVIQLMPPPFSQGWIGNIRTLARAHWWDGLSINRVQDNYVAQWGDGSEKKPLPPGLNTVPESDYVVPSADQPSAPAMQGARRLAQASSARAAGRTTRGGGNQASFASDRDPYADMTGFTGGWPVSIASRAVAPVHCYGMVGVGRNLSPDTGTGAELYAVIGHAPRHLDRNIALVGRVVEGIEHLSSLPRGTEALGFYKMAAERVPIRSVRLASELPEGERPRFEYLSTESSSFAVYAAARADRRDAFFIRPAGGADICNVPVPVRRAR